MKHTSHKRVEIKGIKNKHTVRKRVMKGIKVINRVSMKVGQIATNKNRNNSRQAYESFAELDSHEDTSCLGNTFVPIYYMGKERHTKGKWYINT